MVQPRLAFWLLVSSAVWIGATSLRGGFVSAVFGLAAVAALLAGAAAASRAPSQRSARRVVGAGFAALVVALGQVLFVSGGGGFFSVALALAALYAGAQLSLEREPVAEELKPRNPRGPLLALAVAADEGLLLSWDWNGRIALQGSPAWLASRLHAAAERNRERGWLLAPESAHPLPPALEKPSVARIALGRLGAAEHLRFESEFEPQDPEARETFLAVRANRSAHAYLWRHGDGPRPAIVCVHGYTGGRPAIDGRAFDVQHLHRALGFDVALYVQPLHGPRALGRSSGRGFLGGDPLWTNAAFGQAIWDLRRLTGWLRAEGAPLVGIVGGSLGGYVTALYASLDARLACAVPQVPVVKLAQLVWSELAPERRAALDAAGASEALLDEAWAPHALLRHTPRVAPEGRLIVAGAADRICTPEHTRALAAHWGAPPVHWFAGGHVVPIGRSGARLRLGAFLRQRMAQDAASGAALGELSPALEDGATERVPTLTIASGPPSEAEAPVAAAAEARAAVDPAPPPPAHADAASTLSRFRR